MDDYLMHQQKAPGGAVNQLRHSGKLAVRLSSIQDMALPSTTRNDKHPALAKALRTLARPRAAARSMSCVRGHFLRL